jgi:hypothetical protein
MSNEILLLKRLVKIVKNIEIELKNIRKLLEKSSE